MAKKTADWLKEIKAYHTASAAWRRASRKIVDRYRLEREMSATGSREGARKNSTFNILWSNVQTMKPALFARVPTIEAERRHGDQDPLGRIASMVLERAANEELERNDFFDSMTAVVLDVLLVGRGVPWVRFEADEQPDLPVKRRLFGVESGMEVPEDALMEEGEHGITFDMGNGPAAAEERFMTEDGGVAPPDSVSDGMWRDRGTINERVFCDYVHWDDFAHSPERNWQDLRRRGWVARRVAMTRREGKERFGKEFEKVEMSLSRRTTDRDDSMSVPDTGLKYGEVWEIWDRESMARVFVAKGIEKPLEIADDPYGLVEFFPCPRPAYATVSNEDMVPTPDYLQYSDLADELDDISGRIRRLTRALKLVGVYDASAEGLGKALEGDVDGKMVPVTNFQALVGKSAGAGGGLNGVAQWVPMDHVVKAMLGLYDARAQVKETLYEVSGVSDIVRGQVDPREKATQSRIKAQFATARLDTRRRAVERVARDAARIQIELMAELYSPEALREQSGFDLMPEAADHAPDVKEQIWGQVVDLLENDKIRGFRIDVETDSTVEMDARPDAGVAHRVPAERGQLHEQRPPARATDARDGEADIRDAAVHGPVLPGGPIARERLRGSGHEAAEEGGAGRAAAPAAGSGGRREGSGGPAAHADRGAEGSGPASADAAGGPAGGPEEPVGDTGPAAEGADRRTGRPGAVADEGTGRPA